MLEIAFGVMVKTDGEIIQEVLGSFKYIYFQFIEALHREPRDIDDLIDGIIYLELNTYFERKAIQNK
jgi:hypothetical protein